MYNIQSTTKKKFISIDLRVYNVPEIITNRTENKERMGKKIIIQKLHRKMHMKHKQVYVCIVYQWPAIVIWFYVDSRHHFSCHCCFDIFGPNIYGTCPMVLFFLSLCRFLCVCVYL